MPTFCAVLPLLGWKPDAGGHAMKRLRLEQADWHVTSSWSPTPAPLPRRRGLLHLLCLPGGLLPGLRDGPHRRLLDVQSLPSVSFRGIQVSYPLHAAPGIGPIRDITTSATASPAMPSNRSTTVSRFPAPSSCSVWLGTSISTPSEAGRRTGRIPMHGRAIGGWLLRPWRLLAQGRGNCCRPLVAIWIRPGRSTSHLLRRTCVDA